MVGDGSTPRATVAGAKASPTAAGDSSGLPPPPFVYKSSMSPKEWSEPQSRVQETIIANEASTRPAYQVADAADAAHAKAPQDATFRAKVEAAFATDDEIRSAVESAATHVTHLRKQLGAAEPTSCYTREKSRKVKAVVDRDALEQLLATTSPPPTISECPFT